MRRGLHHRRPQPACQTAGLGFNTDQRSLVADHLLIVASLLLRELRLHLAGLPSGQAQTKLEGRYI
jgi:hypothetical protein